MSNYTAEDFSPIFGPDEKPARPGWYASKTRLELIHDYLRNSPNDCHFWWFWDGRQWCVSEQGDFASLQDRYWFGLSFDPKVRK